MLLAVMREVRNFFIATSESGDFEIKNEVINLKGEYLRGQYVAVTGSLLNDGVYRLVSDDLWLVSAVDERFTGVVYGLRVPRDFAELVDEIAAWNAQNAPSDKVSESFGTYSYHRATDAQGGAATWQSVFGRRLTPYRRMFAEVLL